MSIIAIIPARGGSKRIPRKNVKLFAGLPVIAHTIRAAQNSCVFDRIIVSTDDDEIAAIAVHYGAEVPFRRPAELANDFAGTDAVLQHALQWLGDNGGMPDYFCCLYAASPLTRAIDVRDGLAKLKEASAKSAYTVTSFPYTIFRALKVNEQGRMEMIWPENFSKRSQDFPEAIHDAGQFYWFDTGKYLVAKRLLTDDTLPIFIPRHRVQDIDTPEDWTIAERIFQGLEKEATVGSSDWNSPRLFIRADASATRGTGHVMRMLALAQAWKRVVGTPVVFLCAEIPDALIGRVRAEGFEVVVLGLQTDQAADAVKTVDAMARADAHANWLAADGYHFSSDFQRAVKMAGHRLLVVDDNGENAAYCCDIALNQNIHADVAAYAKRDADTQLLTGTRYTLIRSEFLALRESRRQPVGPAKSVLITFGGADPGNMTGRVAEALREVSGYQFTLIVGGGNPHLSELKAQVAELNAADGASTWQLVANATNMPELLARSDLAITAGGSTCWEMCLLGIPMIAISIAANQDGIVRGLGVVGAALDGGDVADFDANTFLQTALTLASDARRLQDLSTAASELVDGGGASRVVLAMVAAGVHAEATGR